MAAKAVVKTTSASTCGRSLSSCTTATAICVKTQDQRGKPVEQRALAIGRVDAVPARLTDFDQAVDDRLMSGRPRSRGE